jgi:hypothetical protein
VSTLNHSIHGGDFWGWHSTALENGARQAVRTFISNPNAACPTYGPWQYAPPVCTTTNTRENMAFQLLTDNPQVPAPCNQACCRPDGTCVNVPPGQCAAPNKPQGVGTSCSSPPPPGYTTTVVCPKPPVVVKWRSVRNNNALGPVPIMLNPTATGNGLGGPTTEPRRGGIQRIEADFDQPVVLVNPAAASAIGRTTSWPGGVMGAPVAYTPTGVFLSSASTIVMTFAAAPPGNIPDLTCMTFNVLGTVQNGAGQGLVGDTDCMARVTFGDATSDGIVNLSDPLFIKAHFGAGVMAFPQCDINLLNAVINLQDALMAKGQIFSPPRRTRCP